MHARRRAEGVAVPGWGAVLLSMAGVFVGVYLLLGALVWWSAEWLIFQPQTPRYTATAGATLVPVDEGDSIAVVWLPNPRARYTILFSHGNAEDLGDLRYFLPDLRDAGFSVLAYDYRGYGLSTRRVPSERSAYHDLAAAYEHLTGTLGVPPERVILHGRSLGGGIASELASRHPAAGLILESTFVSAFRVAVPRRIFPFDRFGTERRLRDIRSPVLVIHGTRDEVIPFWHGARLLERANPPRRHFWVEGAGHNDLQMVAGESYWRALREFAASIHVSPRTPSAP
jgi:pimeloyl-ACP methyl ester carboxylesterase